jgi:L-threonylcarbamoyladenylate synthase
MNEAKVVQALIREEMEEAISNAVGVLRSGGVIAFPTETFYGLGADISNETGIRKVFSAKSRGYHQPLLILIPSLQTLPGLVLEVPPIAKNLISALWPGGLTLVFEAAHGLSPLLTAGTGKIGIRLSSHPLATAIASALKGPITGTSANLSGDPPCRHAEGVKRNLGAMVDLIIDGGETPGGMGSTLVDVTVTPARILREGAVSSDRIRSLIRVTDKPPGRGRFSTVLD